LTRLVAPLSALPSWQDAAAQPLRQRRGRYVTPRGHQGDAEAQFALARLTERDNPDLVRTSVLCVLSAG
jgi:hypothetical protein